MPSSGGIFEPDPTATTTFVAVSECVATVMADRDLAAADDPGGAAVDRRAGRLERLDVAESSGSSASAGRLTM